MVGVDLFLNKRKTIFTSDVINRFFWAEEIALINKSSDVQWLASKFWCIKETVYKLLHNLNPELFFNKLAVKVDYVNYVFKVKYVSQNDEKINAFIKTIDFNRIYFSDSDEGEYLCVIAFYQN